MGNLLQRLLAPFAEKRASYTDTVVEALLQAASTAQADAAALAAVEACASLIADPFLTATVNGFPIPKRTLYDMGRDVLRRGESLHLPTFDLLTGRLTFDRAESWKVGGRGQWVYEASLAVPTGEPIVRQALAGGVIHCMMASQPNAPWKGQAPWQMASLSASALAEISRGVRDEGKTITGRIWTSPDGATQGQADAMASSVKSVKGGNSVVAETTAQGFGQGSHAAPKADWKPNSTGQDHTPGNVDMLVAVQASVAAAYGVHPAAFNPAATAPALREIKRLAFLDRTLALAEIIVEELSDKLGRPISITWPNMADQSVDVHLRARAFAAIAGSAAGMLDYAALVAGLPPVPDTATPVTPATPVRAHVNGHLEHATLP